MTLESIRKSYYEDAAGQEPPPCRCGHDREEHEVVEASWEHGYAEVCHGEASCPCSGYDNEPPERDPDRRWEEAHG